MSMTPDEQSGAFDLIEAELSKEFQKELREQGLCVKFGCDYAKLTFLKVGECHQTNNGFFTIKIDGWYCPVCGGGYGGKEKGQSK